MLLLPLTRPSQHCMPLQEQHSGLRRNILFCSPHVDLAFPLLLPHPPHPPPLPHSRGGPPLPLLPPPSPPAAPRAAPAAAASAAARMRRAIRLRACSSSQQGKPHYSPFTPTSQRESLNNSCSLSTAASTTMRVSHLACREANCASIPLCRREVRSRLLK